MPRCQDFALFSRQLPGAPPTPRLNGRSLHLLHFSAYSKKIPSIQNLNETTVLVIMYVKTIKTDVIVLMSRS